MENKNKKILIITVVGGFLTQFEMNAYTKIAPAYGGKSTCFLGIISIINEEEITVLHCHNPMGGVLGRLAAQVCGNKKMYTIYTAHGFHFYKGAPILNWMFFYPAERFLARYTDCLITINREDRMYAEKLMRGRLKKVYWIPGVGIKTSKFAPDLQIRGQVRKQLGISCCTAGCRNVRYGCR